MFENTNNIPMQQFSSMGGNNFNPWGRIAPQIPTQNTVTAPNMMQGNQQGGFFKAMPVTSLEEAKAAMLSDGGMYVFLNTSQGEIYTKQYNPMTNSADFFIYKMYKPTQETSYVTYADFKKYDDTLKSLVEEVQRLKGGHRNVQQSNAVNASSGSAQK